MCAYVWAYLNEYLHMKHWDSHQTLQKCSLSWLFEFIQCNPHKFGSQINLKYIMCSPKLFISKMHQ